MSIEYTRKERETINRAYRVVERISESYSHGGDRLDAALKYERAQRFGITNAKALMVREWCEIVSDKAKPEWPLWTLSRGISEMALYAIYCRDLMVDAPGLEMIEAAKAAAAESIAAHEAASARAWDRIK